jgi:hypothetical protein
MATHSPFFLNLTGARIYDLDSYPVEVKKWNELDNVKTYYKFFKDNEDDFKDIYNINIGELLDSRMNDKDKEDE